MAFHAYDPASSHTDTPRYGPGDPIIERQVYASIRIENDVALAHLRKWREDGNAAHLAAVLTANSRMLYDFAKRSVNPRVAVGDLYQEACLGFWQGLEKYDEEKAGEGARAAKVSSVAFLYAKKYVLKFIEDNTAPVHVAKKPMRLAQKYQRLRRDVARALDVPEESLQVEDVAPSHSPAEHAGARVFRANHWSLDSGHVHTGDSRIGPDLQNERWNGGESYTTDKRAAQAKMESTIDTRLLLSHLAGLPDTTARLIRAHFQISNEDVADVEAECGIHPMMVEGIIHDGIAILKSQMGAPPAP